MLIAKLLVALFIVCLAFSSLPGTARSAFAVDEADAQALIDQAQGFIVSGYEAVAGADKAGANVTGLLAVLNNASDLLSRADLAFLKADFDSAADFASRSVDTLHAFVNEASVLRDNAEQSRFRDLMVNVVGSILGTVAVFVSSFVVWGELKRKYGYGGSVSDGS